MGRQWCTSWYTADSTAYIFTTVLCAWADSGIHHGIPLTVLPISLLQCRVHGQTVVYIMAYRWQYCLHLYCVHRQTVVYIMAYRWQYCLHLYCVHEQTAVSALNLASMQTYLKTSSKSSNACDYHKWKQSMPSKGCQQAETTVEEHFLSSRISQGGMVFRCNLSLTHLAEWQGVFYMLLQ